MVVMLLGLVKMIKAELNHILDFHHCSRPAIKTTKFEIGIVIQSGAHLSREIIYQIKNKTKTRPKG